MNDPEAKMWRRQIATLARQELFRRLFSRRSIPVYLLMGLPLAIALLRAFFLGPSQRADLAFSINDFNEMYHVFLVRFIVFFGCAGLFINLFRGELLDRSLHYSFLAPLRREVLVAGKYLGGLVVSVVVFSLMTVATYVLFFLAHGPSLALRHLGSATGVGHLLAYVLIVTMACVGYGALFLLAGLLFRNPMVPAVLFLGWEALVPFLPPALKVVSVSFHLMSLSPLPVTVGPLALIAEPTPPWLAVIGLIGVSAMLLAAASWAARRLEISYASD